jgi:hypothetical protein
MAEFLSDVVREYSKKLLAPASVQATIAGSVMRLCDPKSLQAWLRSETLPTVSRRSRAIEMRLRSSCANAPADASA